ncbi:MAG: STAS domain-containing protein [Phycisphaerae bacterium]|nr:STAS domain-containing protein [Phycisphaerae bacterium]
MTPQRRALTIQVERGTDAVVVRLGGAATIDQADRLNRELRQVAGEPFKRVVMDLSELEFICSMGLGALIVAHVVAQRRKAQVVLAGAQNAIREILETTRLNMIFPMHKDVTSALN